MRSGEPRCERIRGPRGACPEAFVRMDGRPRVSRAPLGLAAGSVPGRGWGWSLTVLVVGDVGLMLPFAAFAGGVGLIRTPRGRASAAATAGLLMAAAGIHTACSRPAVGGSRRPDQPRKRIEARDRKVRTPDSRRHPSNLRYVETNPPSEYSRSIDHPERHYPSRLRLSLHLPAALAGLTLLNTLVGLLAADLTGRFSHRRFAAALDGRSGVAGGVACFAALAAATVFDRDWSNVSGVLGVVTGMAAAVATGSAGTGDHPAPI